MSKFQNFSYTEEKLLSIEKQLEDILRSESFQYRLSKNKLKKFEYEKLIIQLELIRLRRNNCDNKEFVGLYEFYEQIQREYTSAQKRKKYLSNLSILISIIGIVLSIMVSSNFIESFTSSNDILLVIFLVAGAISLIGIYDIQKKRDVMFDISSKLVSGLISINERKGEDRVFQSLVDNKKLG